MNRTKSVDRAERRSCAGTQCLARPCSLPIEKTPISQTKFFEPAPNHRRGNLGVAVWPLGLRGLTEYEYQRALGLFQLLL